MNIRVLPVATSFTATPLKEILVASLQADSVEFFLYSRASEYMLRPQNFCSDAAGALVLLRLEDWLRDNLKSASPGKVSHATVKESLLARSNDFVNEVTALASNVRQVWILLCPSKGWIATRHDLTTACRTYSNLIAARLRKLPVTVIDCPSFLLNGESDDHSTDRLGQMPYTQAGFDQLAQYLAAEIKRTSLLGQPGVVPRAADSTEFATYLASLKVRVKLSPVEASDRAHVGRMLRTIAGFSLTGEMPFLQDDEIERMLTDRNCLLVSVADRLAEYGPTGFVLFRVAGKDLIVEAMALSCVVLGKQAEFAALSALARHAGGHDLSRIVFLYKAAERNQPMQEFLESVAVSEPGLGYVVSVADVEARISESAVNPRAWTVELQSSLDNSSVLR